MPLRTPAGAEIEHLKSEGYNPDDYLYYPETDEFVPRTELNRPADLGFAGRTATKVPASALGFLGGMGATGAAMTALSVPATGGASLIPILGGLAAAGGAGYLQRRLTEKAAPEFAKQQAIDEAAHPYLSTAEQAVLSGPIAGGRMGIKTLFNPKEYLKTVGLKDMGKMAATQAGLLTAQSLITEGELPDWKQVALGAGIGSLQGGAGPRQRAFQRNVLKTVRIPQGVIDAQLPTVADPTVSLMETAAQQKAAAELRMEQAPLEGIDVPSILVGDPAINKKHPSPGVRTVAEFLSSGAKLDETAATDIIQMTARGVPKKDIEAKYMTKVVEGQALDSAAAKAREEAIKLNPAVRDADSTKAANEQANEAKVEQEKQIHDAQKRNNAAIKALDDALGEYMDEKGNPRQDLPESEVPRAKALQAAKDAKLAERGKIKDMLAAFHLAGTRVEPGASGLLLGKGSEPQTVREMPLTGPQAALVEGTTPLQLEQGRVLEGPYSRAQQGNVELTPEQIRASLAAKPVGPVVVPEPRPAWTENQRRILPSTGEELVAAMNRARLGGPESRPVVTTAEVGAPPMPTKLQMLQEMARKKARRR